LKVFKIDEVNTQPALLVSPCPNVDQESGNFLKGWQLVKKGQIFIQNFLFFPLLQFIIRYTFVKFIMSKMAWGSWPIMANFGWLRSQCSGLLKMGHLKTILFDLLFYVE